MYKKDPCLIMSASPHSPHNIILSLIKSNSTVLDIGCNTGYLGKALAKNNVISDGIDINKHALKIAKKYYQHVYLRDLYGARLNIPKKKYDYIILADVLEHLPRPDLLLKDAKNFLDKKGRILISLPNTARFEIRLKLLLGKFEYTSGGILSQDHLRFFTKKSGARMIEECGLEIQDVIPTGLGHMIKCFDTLTAFQFVYICML